NLSIISAARQLARRPCHPEIMLSLSRGILFAALLAGAALLHSQNVNSGGRAIHNEAQRLARWKSVEMPFHSEGLSTRERQTVEKLVDACRLLNDIYWRQSDIGGLALYKDTRNPTV